MCWYALCLSILTSTSNLSIIVVVVVIVVVVIVIIIASSLILGLFFRVFTLCRFDLCELALHSESERAHFSHQCLLLLLLNNQLAVNDTSNEAHLILQYLALALQSRLKIFLA